MTEEYSGVDLSKAMMRKDVASGLETVVLINYLLLPRKYYVNLIEPVSTEAYKMSSISMCTPKLILT